MGIQQVNTPFPAVNNRLFPSISATTAAPMDVVPETGNGLGYFAAPPPGGYRPPGTMEGLGMVVRWPRIMTEWDLIQKEMWANHVHLAGLGDCDASVDGDCGTAPTYTPITSGDPEFNNTVQITVQRINGILPYDAMYGNGSQNSPLVWASTLANDYGANVGSDSRVQTALANLTKRYNFVKQNYPGVTVLPAGSTLPSGSSARAPIIIDYLDGSYAYAPGYGPVAQYGALQVASASVPASPRVSAYTGQIVGTANTTDINAPLVGATPGSGTWGGVDPTTGPGYVANAPPPPAGYPGPLTTGSSGTTGGATTTDTGIIPGVSNTMLFAGGGALVLLLAVMGGRR